MASIKKNIVANYLGQGWSGLMAVAFLPSYVHHLGSEAYGLIGLFAVVQALVTILDMGMSPVLNREMARSAHDREARQHIHDMLRSVEAICFGLAGVIILLGWLSSDYVAQGWLNAEQIPRSEIAHALALMSLVAAFRLCEGIYRGSLFGLEQQIWYNLTYSVISTIRYLGALAVLVCFSPTIEAFFLWQVGVSLATILILATRVHLTLPQAPVKARLSWTAVAGVRRFAGGLMAISFLTMFFLQLDKLLLSRLVSLAELGYYTLAATAANVMFMVVAPVTQAIFPQLVKLSAGNNEPRQASLYHNTTQLVAVITASASMLIYAFSSGIVFMWSGNQDLTRNTAPLLSILVLGSFINCLSYLPSQLQIAHGWTSLLLKINATVVMLFIPLMMLIIPIYGVVGAAWGWVTVNVVYFLLISQFMHIRLLPGHKLKWYLMDILMPTCGAVVAVIVAKQFEPRNYDDRLQWLFFLLFSGVGTAIVSALFSSSATSYVIKLVRGRYKR